MRTAGGGVAGGVRGGSVCWGKAYTVEEMQCAVPWLKSDPGYSCSSLDRPQKYAHM